MSFTQKIKEDIMVASARHCCVCNRYRGMKIEVHHIKPQEQGGEDTFENAIALCFDCHCDAGHYFAGHPKGLKLSPAELFKHKQTWFKRVSENNIQPLSDHDVELVFSSGNGHEIFRPVFVEDTLVYRDKNELKIIDLTSFVNSMRSGHVVYDFGLDKIETHDDLAEYLNKDYSKESDDESSNPQPIKHSFGSFSKATTINQSVCSLKLELRNIGTQVLEDFKIYLEFDNVVNVDSIDKRTSFTDLGPHYYNVLFSGHSGEFIPRNNVLVQNDRVKLDGICIKTKSEPTKVQVKWRLVSRGFSVSDTLFMDIEPHIEKKETIKYVDDPSAYSAQVTIRNKYSPG